MSSESLRTILLVEDEVLIALAERAVLERAGYRVIIARTGEDAVDAATSDDAIELVLMDVDLGPGIDGPTAAESILEMRAVPIVFLSSHTEPDVVDRTEGITSYGYIVKNSGNAVLLASIRMAFRLHAAHVELVRQKSLLDDALVREERASDAVRRSEAMLRNLMENSVDAVQLVDARGRFLDANRVAWEMIGYTREELLSMTIADIDPNYPADGFEALWRAQPKGASFLFETAHRHKDGRLIPVEINGIFFELDGVEYVFGVARDITERERAAEEVARQKRFLETVLATSPDGFWLIDASGRIVEASAPYCAMTGYSPEELRAMPVSSIDVDDTPEDMRARIRRILETGGEEFETRHRRKDGSIFDIEAYAALLPESDGQIISFCRDITERRRLDEQLRSERERLRGIIDGTNVGTWEWNVQTGQTVFNERWAAIVGHTLAEIAPVSIETWERFAHPHDLAESARRLEEHFAGRSEFYDFESRMRHRDGRWVWVLDRGRVVSWTPDGKPLVMMGTHQDITERKEAERILREREERFRTLLDHIHSVPVQGFDRDGIVHYWNAASEELYGYTAAEAIGADAVDLLIPDEMRETMRARTRTMADQGGAIPPTEDWIRRKDGSLVRMMTSFAVVQLPGREPEVFCLDFDVTERYTAQERVAELARERETLLKEVQHRIKNNMNTMVGLLTLQAATLDTPDAADALHDAVGRLKSMEVLYDQLYRTEDHQRGSVARYTEQLVGKVVQIFPAGASLVPTVRVDDFALDAKSLSAFGLIVNELITNAMKYAFNGHPKPELLVSVEREAHRVRLAVQDNGPGLPETLASDGPASSFGLSMVRSLADQLGGSVRLESDRGARVVVEFPVSG